jgi:hypothetical protein
MERRKVKKRALDVIVIVTVVALLAASSAVAATIDPSTRTATAGNFEVQWSMSDPEEIVSLSWMGSSNLTNTATNPNCPSGGDLEYFGNSWVSENEGTPSFVFSSLVGFGTTGTWTTNGTKKVGIESSSSGCAASANLPISTDYQFFEGGPTANRIKVHRQIAFGSAPFAHDVRPYIPRLYPLSTYTEVLHPDASGASLISEDASSCEVGCEITDWDQTWFAIHDPTDGEGEIVRRASTSPAALWVDQDDASETNSSSVLLLQPPGGFTGNVTEVEFLCFYDSDSWTPSLTLPPGC